MANGVFECQLERDKNGEVRCVRCGEPWPVKVPEGTDLESFHRICGERRDIGLGDTLARFFRWLGVRACRRCKRRQRKLNRLFPYRMEGVVGAATSKVDDSSLFV